ncbi:hypothetical protein YYC_02526 [Plasmodium yoelii 17X]|uniref:Uncharacterized protein n=1 Tax=Plasmodium yoelii 17X TaxID=1323249 RepID=V7PML7_PLAYE|nr:hypothetical protein YYC_02526 [Plasmodium yoelii 17X]
MDQINQEPGKNEEENFRAHVDDINNIDKEFSDLQKLKMMNDGAEMQMNQTGAPDSHEMEQEEINNRSIFVGNVIMKRKIKNKMNRNNNNINTF